MVITAPNFLFRTPVLILSFFFFCFFYPHLTHKFLFFIFFESSPRTLQEPSRFFLFLSFNRRFCRRKDANILEHTSYQFKTIESSETRSLFLAYNKKDNKFVRKLDGVKIEVKSYESQSWNKESVRLNKASLTGFFTDVKSEFQ